MKERKYLLFLVFIKESFSLFGCFVAFCLIKKLEIMEKNKKVYVRQEKVCNLKQEISDIENEIDSIKRSDNTFNDYESNKNIRRIVFLEGKLFEKKIELISL